MVVRAVLGENVVGVGTLLRGTLVSEPSTPFGRIPAFLDRDPCTRTTGKADIPNHALFPPLLPEFFLFCSSINAKFVATMIRANSSWIGRMAT